MARIPWLVPMFVVSLAGSALAHPSGEPAYVPTQLAQVGVQAEVLPVGSMFSGYYDTSVAWAFSGWLGYEVVDRIELGIAPRYIGGVKPDGNFSAGHEIDVIPKISFHTRPADQVDVAFSLGVGYSWFSLPAGSEYQDPTGPVGEVDVSVSYPVGSGLWGVAGIGYQRGYQTTMIFAREFMKEVEQEYSTDFFHLGAGLAYRF
jgi:hypothetical protein